MKLTILTTITNPEERQDPWKEAIASYLDMADEVVIVNGGGNFMWFDRKEKIKIIDFPWDKDWSWDQFPRSLNRGLRECTGDWVIRMDIDQMFHDKDFNLVRESLERRSHEPVALFRKVNFYNGGLMTKANVSIAINRNHAGYIQFGATDKKDRDMCSAVVVQMDKEYGRIPKVEPVGIPYFNFDATFRTKKKAVEIFLRMSLARQKYFGDSPWGLDYESAEKVFDEMMETRSKASIPITNWDVIPKYLRERVKKMYEKA